jgi:hypothetical protein
MDKQKELFILLESFFREVSGKNLREVPLDKKHSKKMLLSPEVFELQFEMAKLAAKYNINTGIDTSLYSKSIIGSFDKNRSAPPLRTTDLLLPFLFYLATCEDSYPSAEDFQKHCEKFIQRFKEHLSWEDLMLGARGGTRIINNLAFALKELRDLGLVLTRDKNGNKRTLRLTVPGLLLIIRIIYLSGNDAPNYFIPAANGYYSFNSIRPFISLNKNKTADFNYWISAEIKLEKGSAPPGQSYFDLMVPHLHDEKIVARKELLKEINQALYEKGQVFVWDHYYDALREWIMNSEFTSLLKGDP